MARTALLLALIAASSAIQEDNFVDGQCATNDGADHFPYKSDGLDDRVRQLRRGRRRGRRVGRRDPRGARRGGGLGRPRVLGTLGRPWPAPAPLSGPARTLPQRRRSCDPPSPSLFVSACNSTFTLLVSHHYSAGLATRISRHIVSFHIFSSALAKRSLAASPFVPRRTRRDPSCS